MIGSTRVKSCSRGQTLKESRLQPLKITREIQGLGRVVYHLHCRRHRRHCRLAFRQAFHPTFHTTMSPIWSDLHEERISEKSPFPEDTLESHIWEATLTSEVNTFGTT